MKITDVKAVSVEINRGPTPFHDGGFIVPPNSTAPYGYVEIFTDEGATGFCPAAAPPAVVENGFKPLLVGQNPLEIERIWRGSSRARATRRWTTLMAISKIDIALWDLAGKILGQPVWRLLGGARERVEVYGAGGYLPGGQGPRRAGRRDGRLPRAWASARSR